MTRIPDLFHEKNLWKAYERVAGLDEAGRGALAGPVCVGAVILPKGEAHLAKTLSGVTDSKRLSPRERARLAPRIKEAASGWSVGFAAAEEIDELGIAAAVRLAALRALETLAPDFLLTDFRLELPELDIPQTALVKGDARSLSVASASILAKTARDERMLELETHYPLYGFARHKGYATLHHRQRIELLGYSPVHRKTFRLSSGQIPAAPVR